MPAIPAAGQVDTSAFEIHSAMHAVNPESLGNRHCSEISGRTKMCQDVILAGRLVRNQLMESNHMLMMCH
jgi:hypothetical protein